MHNFNTFYSIVGRLKKKPLKSAYRSLLRFVVFCALSFARLFLLFYFFLFVAWCVLLSVLVVVCRCYRFRGTLLFALQMTLSGQSERARERRAERTRGRTGNQNINDTHACAEERQAEDARPQRGRDMLRCVNK